MVPAKRILIADDNEDIRDFLAVALKQSGYHVIQAASGSQALDKFKQTKPDLAILDIGMGHPDGLEVSKQIRAVSHIPIIILTARDTDIDEVMSLALGVDDFITKPATAQVIALRVGIQLRHAAARVGNEQEILTVNELALNLSSRELLVNNKLVPLTATEFRFLRLLMNNPNRVYSRDEVYEAIEASSEFSSDKLLDTHASRIRQKIKAAGGGASITAVRGYGYRIAKPR
ncbi:MAG: response regulator transcription factor [Candidatus Nanopelagicales bacterium]|nr:response regulator transcription factor [Candidatus Nanopelagicales bacterium]